MIPAYINVFNLLTWTRELATHCVRLGLEPILLDNASTYPPLLEWLERCPYRVVRLSYNGGAHGFFDRGEPWRQQRPYVLTDPDLDLSQVPNDVVARLQAALKCNPSVPKVGLSLEIQDLPSHYPEREGVLAHERSFWQIRTPDGNWDANIDTTFALYDPGRTELLSHDLYRAVRLDRPYTARHRPWYLDPAHLDEEQRYYLVHLACTTMWSEALRNHLDR